MMNRTACRAKNPATCRYHGTHPAIDFSNGTFTTNSEETYKRNLEASKAYKIVLTKKEEQALSDYCNQEYMEINRYLHDDSAYISEENLETIKLLDSALQKTPPTAEPRQLFRASSLKINKNGYEGFTTSEEAETYLKENFPVGKVIKFKGFTSTTETPHSLVDFCYQGYDANATRKDKLSREEYVGLVGATNDKTGERYDESLGNIIYEFTSRDGAPLTDFGQTYAKKEQEILLPRGKKFKVVKVHPNKVFTFNNETVYDTREEKRAATIIQLQEVEFDY